MEFLFKPNLRVELVFLRALRSFLFGWDTDSQCLAQSFVGNTAGRGSAKTGMTGPDSFLGSDVTWNGVY